MIELSINTLNDLSVDMETLTDDELKSKYDINLCELEDKVSKYIDTSYIDQDIFHLFPSITIGMIIISIIINIYVCIICNSCNS
jgi:hypothetical protein